MSGIIAYAVLPALAFGFAVTGFLWLAVSYGWFKNSHEYLSTACYHGLHARCRLGCKFCDAKCRCSCGHADRDIAEPAREGK